MVGDSALLYVFDQQIAPAVQRRVRLLDHAIREAGLDSVVETVPAYASLLVIFDPVGVDPDVLADRIARLPAGEVPSARSRVWRVPVAYGGALGPDLDAVAEHAGLSADGVVGAHSGARYTLVMYGFLPGFGYLAGLPARLAMPRRATPRLQGPEGVIAIGGAQTAVGSIAGPCGWNIIGRTPVRSFDAGRARPALFEVGDTIVFEPVSHDRFEDLTQAARRGATVAERIR